MKQAKSDSEIIFGIISPIGTDTDLVISHLEEHLKKFDYTCIVISVSRDILSSFDPENLLKDEYSRIKHYMDLGNKIRLDTNDTSILMKGVASVILGKRDGGVEYPNPKDKTAYIIKSIKHPDEVTLLRQIYGVGVHLIGVTSNLDRRKKFLIDRKGMTFEQANELLKRDENENLGHGQHTQDAFQNSDYFISVNDSTDELRKSVYRLVDLLFGDPFVTPNFHEYAMFMAYASSLRSADLSRQVGAVIARENEILAMGANDCPKPFGGLYWPEFSNGEYNDSSDGRDYKLGYDSNKKEQEKIICSILANLSKSKIEKNINAIKKAGIGSLTEYGRVVHAEMETLMMCARNNISCKNGVLYVTTFPCHNCAKHIIAAGIRQVVYIEPYPKSKALDFYKAEITEDSKDETKVQFVPFVGVGPHRYIDLFSVTSTQWYDRIRKNDDGTKLEWQRKCAYIRSPMRKLNYIDAEKAAYIVFCEEVEALKKGSGHVEERTSRGTVRGKRKKL